MDIQPNFLGAGQDEDLSNYECLCYGNEDSYKSILSHMV